MVFALFSAAVLGISFIDFGGDDLELESSQTVGYWEGTTYDEKIDADGSLVPTDQTENVIHRSIARAEVLRGEPLQEDLSVEFQTREEFQEDNPFNMEESQYSQWSDTLWGAQLLIPQPVQYSDVRNDVYRNQVLAYYLIGQNEIVVVTEFEDDRESVYIPEQKLIHEITHAIQDQRFGLASESLQSEFTPERQGHLTLVEGEAVVVENLYEQRCERQWDCLDTYNLNDMTGEREYNYTGYDLIADAPYSIGEPFVQNTYDNGGWDAVDELYTTNPPYTSTDVLFENQDTEMQNTWVYATDISRQGWSRYEARGIDGRDSIGHIGMSSMLYHIEQEYDVHTSSSSMFDQGTGRYTHRTTLSDQLRYDSIIPYQQVDGGTGFTWKIVWEDEESADLFVDVYAETLRQSGGSELTEAEEYEIQEDIERSLLYRGGAEFRGVYSINRNENIVSISSADNEEALSTLRPPSEDPIVVGTYTQIDLDRSSYQIEEQDNIEDVPESESTLQSIRPYLTFILFVIVFIGVTYIVVKAEAE